MWLPKSLATPVSRVGVSKNSTVRTIALSKALQRTWGAATLQVGNSAAKDIESNELALLDPKTKAWIQDSLDKTFGFPSIARFSWTTVKVVLEKSAHPTKWYVNLLHLLISRFDRLQDR